jgi:membrane fusion protein (multidrug efflux system)
MFTPFRHTLRQLSLDDGAGSRLSLLTGAAAVGLWLVWGFGGELAQSLPSRLARVEAAEEAHAVEVTVTGLVSGVRVGAGARVHKGEVLALLDPSARQIELSEAEARLAAIEAIQVAAERSGGALAGVASAGASAAEARAAALSVEIGAEDAAIAQAEAEQQGLAALVEAGAAGAQERDRAAQQLDGRRARLGILRQQRAAALAEAQIARLSTTSAAGDRARDAASLQADHAAAAARVARLREELDRCVLRAPIDGTFADQPLLAVGAAVAPGARLGRVVPDGPLQVVAWFDPAAAIGRIAVGQPAEIVVEGAPETRLLPLRGEVAAVSAEADAKGLRVALRLDEGQRGPLVHGAVVAAEVEVDRAAPLTLLWRRVGG